MSLTVALNTAVSGLFANQQAIAATAENIANINTPNFSRREVNFFTDAIPGQFAGVNVDIARAGANRFLQSAGFAGAADAGASSVVADAIARVEASLGAPGENLSFANKLNDAFAAFAELSAAPSSIASKAVAVAALDAAFRKGPLTRRQSRRMGALGRRPRASTPCLSKFSTSIRSYPTAMAPVMKSTRALANFQRSLISA